MGIGTLHKHKYPADCCCLRTASAVIIFLEFLCHKKTLKDRTIMSGMKTRLFLTLCRVKMGAFSLICYQGGASDGSEKNRYVSENTSKRKRHNSGSTAGVILLILNYKRIEQKYRVK